MKHGVSGSWCPVGPAGGRGARGYGEFRRNTLSCGTLQGFSSCAPRTCSPWVPRDPASVVKDGSVMS